jgi:hypothetical protein
MVVFSVAVLLAPFRSASSAFANTPLVIAIPSKGKEMRDSVDLATMVMVALADAAKDPSLQATVLSTSEQLPWLDATETNLTSGARESLKTSLVAACGPTLATVMV